MLEIPPDLTTPETISAKRVPNITETPISAQTLAEFEEFQSSQELAKYQDYLTWRETNNDAESLSITAFREFKKSQQNTQLSRDGVLIVSDNQGREILLVRDTLDSSWNRIDTALINLNIQLLNSSKSNYDFRISYKVGRDGGTNQGWRNWATLLTGRIIFQLKLEEQEGIVIASLFDRNNITIATPEANSLLRQLAVQLKTFAGEDQQFVIGGINPLPGLSLYKTTSGQTQLIIPEKPEIAWRTINRALREANFYIDKSDIDSLHFWIRYVVPGNKSNQGLLARLGLRKNKYPEIIDQYRMQLEPGISMESTIVSIWNANQQPAEKGEEVIYAIFEKLKN
ncbi:MAG: hypothetical protein CL402_02860 [Acidiferrobacteraceae bacterium]|nr:hypothetical protein [Acidiferrobacteraceae bacterium]|tara:strand:- start:51225 stop:52247 length:1023 start_codon:yes stop_codon:yes gene_type:complete